MRKGFKMPIWAIQTTEAAVLTHTGLIRFCGMKFMPEMCNTGTVTRTHSSGLYAFLYYFVAIFGMVLLVSNITAVMSDVKSVSSYSASALFHLNNPSSYCLEKQICSELDRVCVLPLLNTHLSVLSITVTRSETIRAYLTIISHVIY